MARRRELLAKVTGYAGSVEDQGRAAGVVRLSRVEKKLAAADPPLGRVIEGVVARIGSQVIPPSKTKPFEALARAIVYQSVSGAAAATIFHRLEDTVGLRFDPKQLLGYLNKGAAASGLSQSKKSALHGLAEWFITNPKQARGLARASDEDIVETLTAISGIGAWTVNVFLIFNLGRENVLPAGDLGIRRGVQLVCGLKVPATPTQVRDRAQRWEPYRSIACVYLWNAVKLKMTAADAK